MNGMINILKPPGMTSHDVVSFLRRVFGLKKIGHGGTLDPQAAGVLPVCLGQATRLLDYLSGKDKEYLCHLTLGTTTTTQDAWGDVVEQKPCSGLTLQDIERAIPAFWGEITQEPPMYSAIKLKGIPLYERARRGESIQVPARKVLIHWLKIIDYRPPVLIFGVRCSKGTYVRTICHDLGQTLGVGGHLSFLLRTRSGNFRLEDSYTLEEVALLKEKTILPPQYCIGDMTALVLEPLTIKLIKHGQEVPFQGEYPNRGPMAVLDVHGNLHAIVNLVQHGEQVLLKPKKVFQVE